MLLLISTRPLLDAWKAARGTALLPALVWTFLALALAVLAQAVALTEPLPSGRPLTERLTYLSVLALLAGLGSVLNARTPGGKAWAILMAVLVVVFLIPWLEDQTRLRRATAMAQLHLDAPWSIFYGLLVVVAVTNYLPTRCGWAAVTLAGLFILEYLALAPLGWPAERRAGSGHGSPGCWRFSLDCTPQLAPSADTRTHRASGSGSGSATPGGWCGPCACSSASIERPSFRAGRCASPGSV